MIQIYVKPNSNCEGLALTTFEVLSETWDGKPYIYFGEEGEREKREVIGWTSLANPESNAHVIRAIAPDGTEGYLIYGRDLGLRVPDLELGMPIIWISLEDGETDLPAEVFEVVKA